MKNTPTLLKLLTVKVAIVALLLALGVTSFFSSHLSSLKFDYDIESFFAKNDPEVESYNNFKNSFENENDYLLIGIKNNNGIFNLKFLEAVDTLCAKLISNKSVINVNSPTRINEIVISPTQGQINVPLIALTDSEQLAFDKKKIYGSSSFTRSLFSDDTTSLKVIVKTEHISNKKEAKNFITAVDSLMESSNFDEWHLAGRLKTQQFYLVEMRSEMGLFISLALAIIVISLLLILPRIRYVLISLFTLLLSLIIIFGVLGVIHYPINLMIILLPAIILITGTSASIHLLSKFDTAVQEEKSRSKALYLTLQEVGVPIFFNAITTAIGFASLYLIPVEPIQYFGLLTALGILISLFTSLIVTSSLVLLLPLSKKKARREMKLTVLNNIFIPTHSKIKLKRLLTVMALAIGVWVFNDLSVNNYFLDDLNEEASLKKDLAFFEDNFDGIRPLEMIVTAKSKDLKDQQLLKEIDQLSNYVRREFHVKTIISPTEVIKATNQSQHGGITDFYKLPTDEDQFTNLLSYIDEEDLWNKVQPTLNDTVARISARTKDLGNQIYQKKNKKLIAHIEKHYPHLEVELTGAAHLIDRANSNISIFLVKGIFLAVVISTLCIFLLTKSIKLALISIIPNVLPLLFAALIMWTFNVPLKIGTAMIFTIIYGLAVDDTMHFLHQFKNYSGKMSNLKATQQAYIKLRKPMLITTVVLSLGFFVFGFSQFGSISSMGIIVASSLFIALIADFTILPAFLMRAKK